MKVPYSWLNEYVNLDGVSPEELGEKLLSVGFEVEEIVRQCGQVDKIVVGKIQSVTKHENSDRLQICPVDVGEEFGGVIQIVTAATNVFPGAIVPVSLVGATLADGTKIGKSKLRGEVSNGMFCGGSEIGVTENDYEGAGVNGILILKDDAKIGEDVMKYLGMDEIILDISVTANRPDCQSIVGIAREAAAVLGREMKEPDYTYEEDKKSSIKDYVEVSVLDSKTCPKYMAKAIDDIKFIETPLWMKRRLRAVGMNSINIYVDITNYVLTEMGQPMHAFDANLIGGKQIVVRRAENGEKITLLSEEEVELNDSILVIADQTKPLAIAGIMGGMGSSIQADTKAVVFECAKFARDVIRKTSKNIGVRSDSSSRYEKGIDVYTVEKAMNRALNLVSTLGAGRIIGLMCDIKSESVKNKVLTVKISRIDDLLGIEVPHDEIVKILDSLGFEPTITNGELTCCVPNYREDVDNFADLAEEIIRFYGYDHIEGTLLKYASTTNGKFTPKQVYMNNLKNKLVDAGYLEAITYSFTTPKYLKNLGFEDIPRYNDPVKLMNPLGEDVSIMRTTLVHSMLNSLALNGKKNNSSAKLFETARVYLKSQVENAELPCEYETLCVGEYGEGRDFYTIKNAVECVFDGTDVEYTLVRSDKKYLHPGRSADVVVDGNVIGSFGEVHPDLVAMYELPKRPCVLEISIEYVMNNSIRDIKFSAFSKFPPIERDLAFIVDDSVAMGDIESIILKKGGKLLDSVKLFDIYKGEQLESGKKSMAFALRFTSVEKQLNDKDIEKSIDAILAEVESKLGGKLR